jgi:Glycosyltransferase
MKILYVCSGNYDNDFKVSRVFIYEMAESLKNLGIEYDFFLIKGRGFRGYLKALFKYWYVLLTNKYDLIHAVYGLSGFIASLRIKLPVIVSYIGSDVYNENERIFSSLSSKLATYAIFVSNELFDLLKVQKNYSIIPFGIDTTIFTPVEKRIAREKMGYKNDEQIIVFASSFDRPVKNFQLLKNALELINFKGLIVELGKNYSREELSLIFNSADIFALTSFHEGSPQVIKEAMACNCPIVATDVGDIKKIVQDTKGCFITSFDPKDVADKIKRALEFSQIDNRTNGRKQVIIFDNMLIAEKIFNIYNNVIDNKIR